MGRLVSARDFVALLMVMVMTIKMSVAARQRRKPLFGSKQGTIIRLRPFATDRLLSSPEQCTHKADCVPVGTKITMDECQKKGCCWDPHGDNWCSRPAKKCNWEYYLREEHDVARLIMATHRTATEQAILLAAKTHYDEYGKKEGRRCRAPSPAPSPAPPPYRFDEDKGLTPGTCMAVGWGDSRAVPSKMHDACLIIPHLSPYVEAISKIALGLPSDGSCGGDTGVCDLSHPRVYDPELRFYGLDWPPHGLTMLGQFRLTNFQAAISEVIGNNVPGDIVELGVWRGGAMLVAAGFLADVQIKRQLHLFDAFQKVPGYADGDFLSVRKETVVESFKHFGLLNERIHFHTGLFKDTIPKFKSNDPIAVLRVDGNFYDSYQDAFYYLYEKVPIGGIVILDDVYNHPPVMQFWEDFKNDQGIVETLYRIDGGGAWFRKHHHVTVSMIFFRAPQDANKEQTAAATPRVKEEAPFWHRIGVD